MLGATAAWFATMTTFAKITVIGAGIVVPATLVTAATNDTYNVTEVNNSVTYSVDYTEDETLEAGEQVIVSEGKTGISEDVYKVHKVDGIQVSKEKVSSKMISQPVNAKAKLGILEKNQITQTVSIPFAEVAQYDSSAAKGSQRVAVSGVNGTKNQTYLVSSVKGVEKSRELIGETVTSQPVNQVVVYGTKILSNCDPNYSGCVPIAYDVDCAGGSGNGPAYVRGPVAVIGSDIYGLDRDGDGYGCE